MSAGRAVFKPASVQRLHKAEAGSRESHSLRGPFAINAIQGQPIALTRHWGSRLLLWQRRRWQAAAAAAAAAEEEEEEVFLLHLERAGCSWRV